MGLNVPTSPTIGRAARLVRDAWARWCCWFVVVVCLGAGGTVAMCDDRSREYDLKAAFVYNFTRFIEWPSQRFEADDAPIVIGVVGGEGLRLSIEEAVRGRKVGKRPIRVDDIKTPLEVNGIHLLVFGDSGSTQALPAYLERVKTLPIVTVGSEERFVEKGGTIAFLVKKGRIRFALNVTQAKAVQLRLSAHLQKLATKIY